VIGAFVLSFNTTHALSSRLLDVATDLTVSGTLCRPELLVLHAVPSCTDSLGIAITSVALTCPARTLPALLTAVADPAIGHLHRPLVVAVTLRRLPLLACAVAYDDVLIEGPDLDRGLRIDAVDIDQRVYQISQHAGADEASLCVDDDADPLNTPATYPALRDMLALAVRLSRASR
jgi:hypothetical protein